MSTEPSPANSGDADAPDERHRQRRGQRRTVIAVAAAVLVAGGGGAYWASAAGDDSGSPGNGEPPRLALDGYQQPGSGGQDGKSQPGGKPGIAPGEPTNAQQYRAASGALPTDGRDKASVYRPDTGVSRAEVARLAKALGVSGTPQQEKDRWTVGSTKGGSGPALTVNTKASAGNWTYSPAGSDTSPAKGNPVSTGTAQDATRPALKALGMSDAKTQADRTAGGNRIVTAAPRIGGLPTQGWDSTFTVGSDGELTRAQGRLAKTTEGASYPLLSAKETLKQLNARNPQAAQHSGQPDPVQVTGAELGLAAHQSKGKPVLVPSWLYTVDRSGGDSSEPVDHPAVQPKYLQPAKGKGPMLPSPVQTGKSGSGSQSGKEHSGGGEIGAGGSGSKVTKQAVSSYSTEGRTLKLNFWGSVCDKYTASAAESSKSVQVTVQPKEPSKKVCVKMAERHSVTVQLDKPLDGRKVVDTRNHQTLPRS